MVVIHLKEDAAKQYFKESVSPQLFWRLSPIVIHNTSQPFVRNEHYESVPTGMNKLIANR